MEEQRIPKAIAELEKKKCRPNLITLIQIGGLFAACGGIGVAVTSVGVPSIICGSIVAVGGLLTTIAGCIKDKSSIIKCCWPTSNLDNLNRQVEEKETKIHNKLYCCLEDIKKMENGEMPINTKYLTTICNAVRIFGQETEISERIKKILIDILKNNTVLLRDNSLKKAIPKDVWNEVKKEMEERNQRIENLDIRPEVELESRYLSYSDS